MIAGRPLSAVVEAVMQAVARAGDGSSLHKTTLLQRALQSPDRQ
jgi:hypothetical protein